MAGKHTSSIAIIVGLLLVIDSFVVIQNMFTGATTTFVNFFEFILGIIVIGLGWKMREMKM